MNWILFPLGVLITTAGVVILSFRKMGVDTQHIQDSAQTGDIEMAQPAHKRDPSKTSDEGSVSSTGKGGHPTPDIRPSTPLNHAKFAMLTTARGGESGDE